MGESFPVGVLLGLAQGTGHKAGQDLDASSLQGEFQPRGSGFPALRSQ